MDDHASHMPSDEPAALAPLDPPALAVDVATQLRSLAKRWDQNTLWWASGFLAGLASKPSDVSDAIAPQTSPGQITANAAKVETTIAIVFGSQTGNSKTIATQLSLAFDQQALKHRLINAKDVGVKDLRKLSQLFICISTQGDGDPPDDARLLVEDLLSTRAPRLPDLGFSVFGLGDSSYAKFCEVGKQIDHRLEALGAKRLQPRVDADVDFQSQARRQHLGKRCLAIHQPNSLSANGYRRAC
jgi:sulfite reductase (NADPH) flavoprotein alpha-component